MARSMRLARDMYIVLLLHLAWALMAVPVVTRQQRVPASAATWLALILLLMQRKRVLLLDEPFCGLDAESVFVVQQLILQLGCEGRTLLVAADSLALLDGICDDLYVLGGGQVQGRYEHYEIRRAIREAGSAAGFPKK